MRLRSSARSAGSVLIELPVRLSSTRRTMWAIDGTLENECPVMVSSVSQEIFRSCFGNFLNLCES